MKNSTVYLALGVMCCGLGIATFMGGQKEIGYLFAALGVIFPFISVYVHFKQRESSASKEKNGK